MNNPIDIIIPWVDESDRKWAGEKEQWFQKLNPEIKSDSAIRFQSWDNLQYWFRAVEKFMPWVHKIFFVTYGHIPTFLNCNHPRLEVINHKDYIPPQYLPTYNSNTIEMNYFRIKELSENFIIFNDDLIPLQPIEEEYYFRNNQVCDEAVENVVTTAAFGPVANMARYTQINNMMIINRYFKKREVQEKNYEKWFCEAYGELLDRTKAMEYWYDFSGFYDPHLASAMKKSVLTHLWDIEGETLDTASKNKFRAYNDVTQYLIRYWTLCEGNFYPRRTLGKVYFVDRNNYKDVARHILKQDWQMVSLNENCTGADFEIVKAEINGALQQILPDRCSFEK